MFLVSLYCVWAYMWNPLHHHLTPALQSMVGRAGSFCGEMAKQDRNGDGNVSLAELQHGAVVQIVADNFTAFVESELQWVGSMNRLQASFRREVEDILDGDPSPQPLICAAYIGATLLYTVAMVVLFASRDLWQQRGE